MLHVDDAALIRLRDGECDSSEERELRRHLADCSQCRKHAETFNRLVDGFFAAVGEIEPPSELHLPGHVTAHRSHQRLSTRVSQVWSTRRAVRVAATIAVVVALALTTAPARAVVNSGWQALVELLSGKPEQQAVIEPVRQGMSAPVQEVFGEPAVEGAPPLLSRAASFTPQGEVFLIVLAHAQASGTLSITADTARRASVLVFGNADSDELVVFREGVRIQNREASSASYEFTLPDKLRRIEVQVGGRTIVTLSPAELISRTAWHLDFAGAGTR